MNRRLVINLTASATWRRRPVGIIRVERELTKQLKRLSRQELIPVVLDVPSSAFKELTEGDFDRVMANDWVTSDDPDGGGGIDIYQKPVFNPLAGDRFISVGSDWSFGIPALVAALYGEQKALVSACYDLIPLLFPEYTPDANFYQQFIRHYTDIAQTGDWVFAISENSKTDLVDFWKSRGLDGVAPPVKVVPLAGLARVDSAVSLTASDRRLLETVRRDGDYIIFVSTIEPRKNHQLLLDLWRELFVQRGTHCPQLIFVGMRGWGSTDILGQLGKMSAAKAGRIKWLEGVSDQLLPHLYESALFAVFPSVYEGWGLAATEAMVHGKVCLISNSSALGEAAQNLVPSLSPNDFLSWRDEITRLIDDANYRVEIEKNIVAKLKTRSWDDFGSEFYELLMTEQ